MTQQTIPTPSMLSEISQEVAATMFGSAFHPDQNSSEGAAKQPRAIDHALSLSMSGEDAFRVAVAWQGDDGQILGGKMFGCPAEETDPEMVRDALGELLNIVAGQVKSMLGSSHTLGLPAPLPPQQSAPPQDNVLLWQGVWLQSQETSAALWVAATPL